MARSLTFATAFLTVVLASGCVSSRPAVSPTGGKQAPGFALKDRDGYVFHLSDYRGQVVALNFWATWCYPCRKEMPWLDSLKREYEDRGFAVIGISKDYKGWQAVLPFLAASNVTYRVAIGTDQIAQLYGGAEPVPTTFLIGREGNIDAVYAGIVDRMDFERRVRRLLQRTAPRNAKGSEP